VGARSGHQRRDVPPGKKFTVPGSGLGTLTVAADGDIYCQPTLATFNKANVNKFNF
jgi:hypothetical protein